MQTEGGEFKNDAPVQCPVASAGKKLPASGTNTVSVSYGIPNRLRLGP